MINNSDWERNGWASRFFELLIEKEGMSWRELAEVTGVDYTFIRRAQTGERVYGPYSLRKMAEALPNYKPGIHFILTATNEELQQFPPEIYL